MERREALEKVVRHAHDLGCDSQIGGGQAGGLNIRYGSIGYALMDINTEGIVKLYVKPHPNKDAPQELSDALNGYIEKREALTPKSFPIASYGHIEESIEDIPEEALTEYLDACVKWIRETYYAPYLGQEYLGLRD